MGWFGVLCLYFFVICLGVNLSATMKPICLGVNLSATMKPICLGVNLSATMKPMHPKKLHSLIYSNNKALFDAFLDFPKVGIFLNFENACIRF